MNNFSYLPPELRLKVLSEIIHPRFNRRTHAHRKTYDAGCRGPLCLLASTQYDESRRRAKAAAQNKPYKRQQRRRTFSADTEALLLRAQHDYRHPQESISA